MSIPALSVPGRTIPRYVIEYTPVLAGNFSAEVLVAGAMIPPSGSMGDVTVLPSFAGLRGKLQVNEVRNITTDSVNVVGSSRQVFHHSQQTLVD